MNTIQVHSEMHSSPKKLVHRAKKHHLMRYHTFIFSVETNIQ